MLCIDLDKFAVAKYNNSVYILVEWEEYIMINLDMNENKCAEPILLGSKDISMSSYPRYLSDTLTKKIAKKLNVNEEVVVLTNGIDEGIYLFCKYVSKCGWTMLVDIPNYIGIQEAINATDVNAVFIKQCKDYDYEKTIDFLKIHKEIKAVYLANPRNPFGDYLGGIERVISYCADNGVVVFLDEAYIEFCAEDSLESIKLLGFDNLIVARTFSKAYGLASIRCGYILSSNYGFANELRKMWQAQPYHISQHSLVCALFALDDEDRLHKSIEKIGKLKNKFYILLDRFSIPYIKTKTNFVCVKNINGLADYLKVNSINVMPTELVGLKGFIRITIGNDFEMDKLAQLIIAFGGGNYETV